MMKYIKSTWIVLFSIFFIAFANPVFTQETSAEKAAVQEAAESVEPDVLTEAGKKAAERRKKIVQEAVDALEKTEDALTALEEERTDDALDALSVVTGRLELIVSREPELALAPTRVVVSKHDVYSTTDAIEAAIYRAENAFDDGKVQQARRLLDELRSELVISVTSLPLATYPDAIKAITPLIDEGNIKKAKQSLQAALNTLVVTDHVVPLPVLRSDALLERAAELAEKSDRTVTENKELSNKLAAVRNQLEMAELLGYGDEDDYESLYTQLDEIEDKTQDGQSGEGFFKEMKDSMTDLWASLTN